jgi:hypothetical protein
LGVLNGIVNYSYELALKTNLVKSRKVLLIQVNEMPWTHFYLIKCVAVKDVQIKERFPFLIAISAKTLHNKFAK